MVWPFSKGTEVSSPPPAPQSQNDSVSDPLYSGSTQEGTAFPNMTETPEKSLSREELADKELQFFLQELNADARPSSTKYSRIGRQPPPSSPTSATPSPNQATLDSKAPLSEQLLPTTMSCRVAFDEAFYCNSFGGKFNDIYRYGGLRSCSENWNKFWFCMRTRSYGETQKGEAIREWYRKREEARYGGVPGERGKSSEDVWRSRERKVEWGEAFSEKDPGFEGTDEEFNRVLDARKAAMAGTSR